MYQEGRLITPVLEGYPWLEKPPLYYWISIPFVAPLGAGELAARLGSAFCGLIASMAIFWLGARLWNQAAGFIGAAILITSVGFCGFARSASPDMAMTACLTTALAILCVAAEKETLPTWKVLTAYVWLGLAILAKGPVALILAVGIAILFWCLDDRGGTMRRWHPILGLLITGLVALPWFLFAYLENGYSFVLVFLINHNFARYVTEIHHHAQPFYYFIPVLLGLLFPWTGWLPVLLPRELGQKIRSWRHWDRAWLFLICWIGFPFLFFSLSQSKLAGYILPVLPPLALLLGHRLTRCIDGAAVRGIRAVPWLHLSLSAAVAISLPIVLQESYRTSWWLVLPLSLFVLAPALVVLWASLRNRWGAAVRATVFQGLILVLAVTQFGYPILARSHSARDIAHQALALSADRLPIATYRSFNHGLTYYTRYGISAQLRDRDALTRFALRHPEFLIVTEEAYVEEVRELAGFLVTADGEQGKYQLLHIKHR
jgi:4-amino-4-deoxy-L-arabinose transferase-like glycosyltransferase